MRKHLPVLIILAASVIVHFLFYGHPNETVFDEVHFGKFISGYFTGEYFFDIHPPLGKLLISAVGYVNGFQPGFSFAEIGQKFPDNAYLWLRLLPTIAGILLPLVIFYLALEVGLSRLAAFAVGALAVLENSLLTQSRFILLDSFLLLFGFSSLFFYLKYRRINRTSLLILTGIFGALAASVKWTGAAFLAIPIIMEALRVLRSKEQIWVNLLLVKKFNLLVLPLAIYFAIFAIHLGLLNKSGPGDAFMTIAFQKSLKGNQNQAHPEIKPLNLFEKFVELNLQMYKSNATLTATHPYSSHWYSWPFMVRPIYYWYQADTTTSDQLPATSSGSRIYFLGNPAIWWASTIAVFYLLISVLLRKLKADGSLWLLAGAYFFNLLPFIGIKRAMFLYHYLTALIFAILILVYLLDKLPKRKTVFAALIVASLITFIYFAPLSYGLPLTDKAYNARVWFPSWR